MSQWFPFQENKNLENRLLFCFHHAGGTAAVYRSWVGQDSEFSVLPVELPGKATRMGEPFIENMEMLSDQIAEAVAENSGQREIFLFGHSMGAAITFQVAWRLENIFHKQPAALIVAGRHPPHFPNRDRYHSDMGTDVLLQEMIRISGAPDYLLQNKELQDFILPQVRRDYKLNESFRYHNEKLSCRILAYAGSEDEDAPWEIMEHWSRVTTGKFELERIEGDHFFVTEGGNVFFQKMIKALREITAGEKG